MGSALNITAKYLLSVYELRRASRRGGENAPPWESKSIWVFYIELTTGDFLRAFPLPHQLMHLQIS
jgi:E3 ubiquitin-protein ligase synoviolin